MTININSLDESKNRLEFSKTPDGLIAVNAINDFYEIDIYGEFELEEIKKVISILEDDNKRP
jgi:hypothetical protein